MKEDKDLKKAIYWFTKDLRLKDNPLLAKAIEENNQLLPVYCLDRHDLEESNYGCKKTGFFRVKFLLESLVDLNDNLKKVGSGLIILQGNPAIEISKLAQEKNVQKVYTQIEYAWEEMQIQKAVERNLKEINCSLEKESNATLYHPTDLPFSTNQIPHIFTEFRKLVEKKSSIRDLVEAPIKIKSPIIPEPKIPTLQDLGFNETQIVDGRAVIEFKGGETEALKRLNYYLFDSKLIAKYKQTRNGMVGEAYSSKFSAWLSLGCISPKQIYHQIKKFEKLNQANESTYWLVFELIWRDFFRFMFKKHGNKYFLSNGIKEQKIFKQTNNSQKILESWKNGKTNNAFIDANMNELNLTGFMSNRGRQNVASYFCHNLQLDWRIGAAYFQEKLIDYCVYNNWGNWAYIAGVGNDPRESRQFNIEKQAQEYDKNKIFTNLWLK